VLHPAFAVGGVAGVVLAVRFLGRRALVPLALLALGTLSFLSVGFAGLPLLTRYFFVGGMMLALFLAIALAGWADLARGARERRAWMVGAALLAVVIAATLPYEHDAVAGRTREANRRGGTQRDLDHLVADPRAAAAIDRCPPFSTRAFRARPQLLFLRRDARPIPIVARQAVEPTTGVLLRSVYERMPARAIGFRPLAASGSWSLLARCSVSITPP
jgi:hypothetical protein